VKITIRRGPGAVIVSPPPPGWIADDDPAGTLTDPFHSISAAIAVANGRDVHLRGGRYVEPITVDGVHGGSGHPITIAAYDGEPVTVDCFVPDFLHPTAEAHWEPVDGSPDEFVWTQPSPAGEAEEVRRGAFLDTHRHTRLISYSRAEDLRSPNEFNIRIEDPRPSDEIDPDEPPPGDNYVWVANPEPDGEKWIPTEEPRVFRNWMYMGPGIWFDDRQRKVHIRLSHTHNNVLGWPDYTGVTDPRTVGIALSKSLTPALRLTNCTFLRLKDITLRFGGQETVRIRNCTDIEFDHVHIRAGSRAIRLEAEKDEHNARIVFHDCEIDGGLPTWLFRSDRKDEYHYVAATLRNPTQADVEHNTLGKSTTNNLLSSRRNAAEIQVHHCELVNGHDVCIFGPGMRFHHNWVDNINDDALFMGSEDSDTKDAWVYRNVVTKVLTTLSFASETPLDGIRIFRNLFDIREPTLGIRPGKVGDNPLRQGQFFKGNGIEGPFDLWHNTCLVRNAGATFVDEPPTDLNRAGFTHYRQFHLAGVRRSYNNVFVAAYPDSGITRPIAFLPPRTFEGPTDGNVYERLGPGPASQPRFAVTGGSPPEFVDLDGYNALHDPWEREGVRADPLLLSFDSATGHPHLDDDLRPRDGSPAKGSAVAMPADMATIDRDANVLAKRFGGDRGCYWTLKVPAFPGLSFVLFDRMSVGVKGRRKFPR